MPALSDSTSGAADCGAGTQATITAGYQAASHTIYEGELASPEVTDDLRHVTSSDSLARGVADGDQAIVRAETHKIVYTHHWHIRAPTRPLAVRPRSCGCWWTVCARSGHRSDHLPRRGCRSLRDECPGRPRYEKLVTRFTGLPIELYP